MKASILSYTLIQAVHNIGAALTLALALLLIGQICISADTKKVLWALLLAWGLQGFTGICFGLSSLYFYGEFPDIHNLAIAAMGVKVGSVAAMTLLLAFLIYKKEWDLSARNKTVFVSLSIIALVAASVLRWNS
jgi:hypothetical protein